MKHDPRIGKQAYLTAGIGFSGGTLGRDLQVLEQLNREKARGVCPIFGEIWRYNRARMEVVRERCEQALGTVHRKTIGLLGMTYKPGTSTLRRSLSLRVAKDLLEHGASVQAYDPKADWKEFPLPLGLVVSDSSYEAVRSADIAILLTEWSDFLSLDYGRVKAMMNRPVIFDTKDILKSQHQKLRMTGFEIISIGRPAFVEQK
jgi:UDPglucose 6-dehydrogenase